MYYYVLKESFDETNIIMNTVIISVALVAFMINYCKSVAVNLPETRRFNNSK